MPRPQCCQRYIFCSESTIWNLDICGTGTDIPSIRFHIVFFYIIGKFSKLPYDIKMEGGEE